MQNYKPLTDFPASTCDADSKRLTPPPPSTAIPYPAPPVAPPRQALPPPQSLSPGHPAAFPRPAVRISDLRSRKAQETTHLTSRSPEKGSELLRLLDRPELGSLRGRALAQPRRGQAPRSRQPVSLRRRRRRVPDRRFSLRGDLRPALRLGRESRTRRRLHRRLNVVHLDLLVRIRDLERVVRGAGRRVGFSPRGFGAQSPDVRFASVLACDIVQCVRVALDEVLEAGDRGAVAGDRGRGGESARLAREGVEGGDVGDGALVRHLGTGEVERGGREVPEELCVDLARLQEKRRKERTCSSLRAFAIPLTGPTGAICDVVSLATELSSRSISISTTLVVSALSNHCSLVSDPLLPRLPIPNAPFSLPLIPFLPTLPMRPPTSSFSAKCAGTFSPNNRCTFASFRRRSSRTSSGVPPSAEKEEALGMAGRKDSVDGVKGIGDEDERAIETLDPRPTGRPKSNSCGDVGEGGGIECRRPVGRETSSERPRSVRSSSGEPRRFCSLRVRRTWSRRSSAVRVLVEANSLCAGEGGAGARLAKGT